MPIPYKTLSPHDLWSAKQSYLRGEPVETFANRYNMAPGTMWKLLQRNGVVKLSRAERFWNNVTFQHGNDCWPWKQKLNEAGYGRFTWAGKVERAHRVAYMISVGPIPEGQNVLHKCDNPACARPDHLFLGTDADNVSDKVSKGRQMRGEKYGNRTKLTNAAVRRIRALRKSGWTHQRIAERFTVAQSTISRVLAGLRWSHI